jgi:hypothetical protein
MGGPGSGMPEPPLTPAQRLYLEAFDRFLLAPTLAAKARARAAMACRLNLILTEARLPLPRDTKWTDAIVYLKGRNGDC